MRRCPAFPPPKQPGIPTKPAPTPTKGHDAASPPPRVNGVSLAPVAAGPNGRECLREEEEEEEERGADGVQVVYLDCTPVGWA
ncbi:hypothetical protein S40285_10454 [Stachybotrys chlorohalonatus IBT 40285]|uniref:Uncharacterized protein n=1 Tax=Stachybotrys chlorohalonatus (strain IBT 40285) TaxID=1283841 RepID=A0A084QM21_STAC4|nr:hypothetical protein S40285_10454 [Stachybotrys chlorohalonata IBT 40285]